MNIVETPTSEFKYKSDQIDKLADALAQAQAEMPPVGKTKNNSFFKSKYASKDDMIDCSQEVLGRHGLAVAQYEIYRYGKMFVHTMLTHKSGQFIIGESLVEPEKQGNQEYGKCLSYKYRYGYGNILRLSYHNDEDDDGQSETEEQTGEQAKPTSDWRITPEQEEILRNKIGNRGDISKEIFRVLEITTLSDIKKTRFNETLAFVEKQIAAAKPKQQY